MARQFEEGWMTMYQKVFTTSSGARIPFTQLGLGTAAIGNLYRARTDAETDGALQAAWDTGIRYFDTAPLYGLGLAETRLNRFLRGKPRDQYVLSTKVGRLLEPCAPDERTGLDRFFGTPSRREIFDYSYDGIMRSVAFSLERLGQDRIDILYVHDIDLSNHGSVERRDAHIDTLMAGGYRALCELRDQKVIKAFGAGINDWETCEVLAARGDFDLFLLAGQYSLLRQESLKSFLPMCEARGIGIVLGGVYNSGILATGAVEGAMFDYYPASPDVLERVRPVLGALGDRILQVGTEPGQGAAMKAVNQLLCGIHIAAAAESISLARKIGIDARVALEILVGSSASSWMLKDRGPRMLEAEPTGASTVDIFVKDLGIVLEAGRDSGSALPLAAAAHQMFLATSGRGDGDADDSQVIRSYVRLNEA
jgi:D-threo-aldose 1-dehydrogenase